MKFVILAALRSGTHLLATLLNSHSQLKCYDESFAINPNNILEIKKMKKIEDNEGFILMYNHVVGRMSDEQREYLLDEFEIIRLVRNDIDAHALSLYNLNHNNSIPSHSNKAGGIKYNKKINTNHQKRVITKRTKWINNFLKSNNKPILKISYEWLTNNKNINKLKKEKSKVICNYLGVKTEILTTDLKKTRNVN